MHLLGEIARDDAFLELLDHPAVFPVIWSELGWNIHLYHCHLDVTPPRKQPRPARLGLAPRRRPPEPRARLRPPAADVAQGGLLALRRLGSRPRQHAGRPRQPRAQQLPRPDASSARLRPARRRSSRCSPRPATPSSSTAACGTHAATTSPSTHAESSSSPTATAGSGPETTSASTRRASASAASPPCAASSSASRPAASHQWGLERDAVPLHSALEPPRPAGSHRAEPAITAALLVAPWEGASDDCQRSRSSIEGA